MKVNSPSWHEHTNEHGFRFLGMQPTSSTVHANPDVVVLMFCDDETGAGLQIVMAHESFKSYLLTLAKARETMEAKQDDDE